MNHGAPQVVQPRLGQGAFRIAVTSAYGACAVSGEHSFPALEAAHVRPYADGGAHALPNGLLLRADVHRLYDAGYAFLARYERVPVWLAWESFGDLNGTDTMAEMAARIEAIRHRTGSAILTRSRDY